MRFVELEGWEERTRVTGGTPDHYKYRLRLDDGRILQTRISHPPGKDTYGDRMWSHILRDQLDVSPEEFWACVLDGVIPERSRPAATTASDPIPADLAWQLVNRVGLSEDQVRGMTKDEAVEAIRQYWSES